MLTVRRAGDRLMPEEKLGQSIVRKLLANRIRGLHEQTAARTCSDTRSRSLNLLQNSEYAKPEKPPDCVWKRVLELYNGRGELRRDKTPTLEAAAQREGEEAQPIDMANCQFGNQLAQPRPVGSVEEQCRDRLIGVEGITRPLYRHL